MHEEHKVKPFYTATGITKFLIIVLAIALLGGVSTGFVLSKSNNSAGTQNSLIDIGDNKPQTASQDNRTFRDFAEGKITIKPAPKDPTEYSEGTHMLIRENAQPVALTSSVVDLSLYENKSVKVYGETQKALKEGWLMDVGRVEEKQ